MPIVENKQTEEEINAGNQVGESKRQSLAEKIKGGDVFKNLDIPTGAPEEVAEEPIEDQETQETEESQEEEVSEDAQADDLSDLAEDMIPKSKIQPRIDKLSSENKRLKAELENARVNKATEDKPADEISAKLQKMSETELRSLRREVRTAQLANPTDKKALNDLLDLEEKIEDTIRNAPQRFMNAQVNAFNRKADELANNSNMSEKELAEAAPKIVEMARGIYQKYPKLQSDIEGQAIALEIAAERYQELSKYSLKSSTVKNLKSQVNTLKRKTSLDNGSSKMGQDTSALDQVRKNAQSGNRRDKERLIREDPRFNVDQMIPAEYR